MDKSQNTQRLGPILLESDVTITNAVTKLYAAFITVAMLSGMGFLQGYILTEHLNIPRGQQGTVAGDLLFWTEILSLLLFTPFGVLADRIGRRPVYIFGILLVALGYGLYPFATTAGELLVYRLIYAAGATAVAGMMATLTNDYPQEKSRGKFIGLSSMMNILGTVFMAGVIGQIPAVMMARGYDAVTSGKYMFLAAAAMCVITALVTRLGLRGGTPAAPQEREDIKVLVMSGLRHGKNPRIALSYAASFAARSDLVIKGSFLALWAIQDGAVQGMSPAQAMARFGGMIVIMQGASFCAAPVFGWFIDRVNRVTAAIVALAFATAGYLSMGIITSPLDFAMVPFFILISFGSGFIMKASLALVGQEAPPKERGSVIALNGMFGAFGIMILTVIGGRLFDAWGPSAPFLLAGAYQAILFIAAITIRIVAPGPDLVGQRRWFTSRGSGGVPAKDPN